METEIQNEDEFKLSEKHAKLYEETNNLKRLTFIAGLITFVLAFISSFKNLVINNGISIVLNIVIYILLAIPLVFLFRSVHIFKDYFVNNDKELLNEAIYNEKRYWKITGVYAVLFFILIVLVIAFGGVATLMSLIKK